MNTQGTNMNSMNVSFAFRTYEEDGILLFHKFTSQRYVKLFLDKGKIKKFNDARWHMAMLTTRLNSLVLTVDNRPMKTTRLLNMRTGAAYLIGGGVYGMPGFVCCMRLIRIDGNYKLPTDWKEEEYCCKGEVVFNTCQMMDRCNPNPCKKARSVIRAPWKF
ncbi:biological adhesion [Homalodisca vitripennis]|nr:biological adhesion [Homalodisca vitripennis]